MNSQFRKIVACFVLATMLGWQAAPAVVSAADNAGAACADAQAQAKADISGTTWFVIGCLAGVVGYLVAAVTEANPPATALLGKDPQYVATYTDCYRREGKKIKTSHALTGCLAGTAVSVLIYVVVIAAASNNDGPYYYYIPAPVR